MFFRNYDASIGRWIGVDPMADAVESMSPYQYAGNNPGMINDPMGDLFDINTPTGTSTNMAAINRASEVTGDMQQTAGKLYDKDGNYLGPDENEDFYNQRANAIGGGGGGRIKGWDNGYFKSDLNRYSPQSTTTQLVQAILDKTGDEGGDYKIGSDEDGRIYFWTNTNYYTKNNGDYQMHVQETKSFVDGGKANQGGPGPKQVPADNSSFWPHLVGPGLIALGQPINYLKPIGALGSKPGSSVASYTLSKVLPQRFTKVLGREAGEAVVDVVGTNVIGRALGRFVPFGMGDNSL